MAKAANGTLPSMPEKQPRFMDRFSKATKVGFVLLGYFLGIIGVLIDWAIGHKKKMMECSAEAIWYGLIGWGASMITRFALLALGINKTDYLLQLFGPGVTVWNILWCICGACFIVLSMLWIYGLRTKMTDAERAYNLKGDNHFHNGEKTLRYDGGITVNALPEEIWPYMQQAGQSKGGWYSFERLERLFTFDIRNHYDWKKYPQWQNLHVGEFQWFHQAMGNRLFQRRKRPLLLGSPLRYGYRSNVEKPRPKSGRRASPVVPPLCVDVELGGVPDQ